jgi:hypothetical protein
MSKRGDQEKIIQALLKKIGKALIKESKPVEVKKTPREELLELYLPPTPSEREERYVDMPYKEIKDKEVMLTLEAIDRDKEQIAKQKQSMEQEKAKIADQHKSLQRASLEVKINGIRKQ